MIALAYILVSIVTQRLIDAKVDVAKTEIDRARVTVEQQLSATSMSSSTQVRINSARAALTERCFVPGKCLRVTATSTDGDAALAFRTTPAVRVAMPEAYSMTFCAAL